MFARGVTPPLRGAETDAQVAVFCKLIKGRTNDFFLLYKFFDSLAPGILCFNRKYADT